MTKLALAVAGSIIVAIGAALAIGDLVVYIDPKESLSAGDDVMLVEPGGWVGPFPVTARENGQIVVDIHGDTRVVDTTAVMPLSVWREREHKNQETKR